MSFAWTPITQTSTTNLVTNGTMEVDANWANANTPTVNVRSSTRAIEGTYSRLFTVDAQYDGIVSSAFTTSSSSRYLVSFWVYPDDTTGARVAIYDGSSYPIVWEYIGLTQDAWNQIVFIHRQVTGSAACVIYFQSNTNITSGSYYIDDVRVTALDLPVPTTNLVTNGTMEADSNWTSSGTPTTNVRSSTTAHSGTYSRRVVVDAIYEGIQSDVFTTTTNDIYYVSFWVYPDDSQDVYFGIRNGANTGWNVIFTAKTLIQDAWNQVEFYYEEKAGGAGAYIVFQSAPTGSGTGGWYYDDVFIAAINPKSKFQIGQFNEIKTNVDHLTTQLGISAYSWTVLPVSANTIVTSEQVNQLMTAISYVDTNNTCATHNVTYDSGALSSDDNAIHTGKDASVLTGQDSGIHTGKDASVLSGQDSGIHTGKDASVLSGQDSGIHTGKDVSVWGPHYAYYLNDHNGGILSGQYSTVYNPQYASNCAANWGSAQNGANGAINSGAK